MEQTRRDALKKGAVGGALLWAAPAITTVSRASAQTGTPPPPPTCTCTASGFALSATGNILGTDIAIGPVQNAVEIGSPGDLIYVEGLFTNINDDPDVCSAESGVALLQISATGLILEATVLTSNVDAPCDCTGGGTSSIASLTLNGSDLTALITGAPNQTVVDAAGITLVVNEQTCSGDVGVVRALHLTVDLSPVPIELDLIVAEARAGNDNAACGCPVA